MTNKNIRLMPYFLPCGVHKLKDRTHDATLRATLRAMGWAHGAIVA